VELVNLAHKVHAIRTLLETLNDPYPTPHGTLKPDSGPSPSRYVPCQTCRSTGRVRARGGHVVCAVCLGAGERRRSSGEPAWDAYLGMTLTDAAELPREPEPPRLPLKREAGYAWEEAQAAHDRNGSYTELRRHLEWLRQTQPRRHHLVMVCLVEHQQRELGPRSTLDLELGVLALALRMRRPRVPRWLAEPAPQPKPTVAALATAGLSPGQIARVLGLTKRAVRRQLKRIDSREARSPREGAYGR
jgi:hypothetical protein